MEIKSVFAGKNDDSSERVIILAKSFMRMPDKKKTGNILCPVCKVGYLDLVILESWYDGLAPGAEAKARRVRKRRLDSRFEFICLKCHGHLEGFHKENALIS